MLQEKQMSPLVLLVFIFHSLYNERREKQAAAQQTFVFHKPLTNESPAKAGSRARMRGIREWTRAQEKSCKNNKITSNEEKSHGRSIKLYWTDAYF